MAFVGRKIAPGAQETVESFAQALQSSLGEQLVALVVSGEATREDFVTGRSAIDSLAILSTVNADALNAIRSAWKPLARKGLQPPVTLTPQDLTGSLDVFPVEFLLVREAGVVVAGAYDLSTMEIIARDLRLQCERELRGLALHTRLATIRCCDDGRAIGDWLLGGSGKLDMLLLSLDYLGRDGTLGADAVRLSAIGEASGVDCSAFAVLHQLRGQKRPSVAPEALSNLERTLTALVEWVDTFDSVAR